MAHDIEDGGPAFPSEGLLPTPSGYFAPRGMSLRDWFAGQALAGICAHPDTWGFGSGGIVSTAYELADTMIAARKGGAA